MGPSTLGGVRRTVLGTTWTMSALAGKGHGTQNGETNAPRPPQDPPKLAESVRQRLREVRTPHCGSSSRPCRCEACSSGRAAASCAIVFVTENAQHSCSEDRASSDQEEGWCAGRAQALAKGAQASA